MSIQYEVESWLDLLAKETIECQVYPELAQSEHVAEECRGGEEHVELKRTEEGHSDVGKAVIVVHDVVDGHADVEHKEWAIDKQHSYGEMMLSALIASGDYLFLRLADMSDEQYVANAHDYERQDDAHYHMYHILGEQNVFVTLCAHCARIGHKNCLIYGCVKNKT